MTFSCDLALDSFGKDLGRQLSKPCLEHGANGSNARKSCYLMEHEMASD